MASPAAARRPAVLDGLAEAIRRPWSDRRAETVLATVACVVLALIVGMVVFVFAEAWPSFKANGVAWFGSGGDVDQQLADIFTSPGDPELYRYHLRAWPLLWGTILTTG